MSIPEIPGATSSPSAAVLQLFVQLHQHIRDELRGLSEPSLEFVPVPGANPIGVIVRHLLGSEAETMCAVAGVSSNRDRDAEFVVERLTLADLHDLLASADHLVREIAPLIDDERLSHLSALPTLPADDVRPRIAWLIGNYGHAREHLGQIQLTRQVFENFRAGERDGMLDR